MSVFLSAVNAGIILLVNALEHHPFRAIGPITADVTVEEYHRDELTITEHPVEQGAAIADHAYKNPAVVGLTVAWTNSDLTTAGFDVRYVVGIYEKLLALQESRVLFTLHTGKRVYPNMLLKTVITNTDYKTENSLFVKAQCQQVIITRTSSVTLSNDPDVQESPELTAPTVNSGAKQLQPAPSYREIDET